MSIKEKVINLNNNYRNVFDTFTKTIEDLKSNKIYMSDYINERISETKKEMDIADTAFNNKFLEIFQTQIDEIKNKRNDNAPDFQLKLSNALKFYELSGDGLSDAKAFELFKPILGDFPTMSLIAPILNSKRIPVTAFAVSGYNNLISSLKNLQTNATGYFNHNSMGDLSSGITKKYFMDQIESHEKLVKRLDNLYAIETGEIEKAIIELTEGELKNGSSNS